MTQPARDPKVKQPRTAAATAARVAQRHQAKIDAAVRLLHEEGHFVRSRDDMLRILGDYFYSDAFIWSVAGFPGKYVPRDQCPLYRHVPDNEHDHKACLRKIIDDASTTE